MAQPGGWRSPKKTKPHHEEDSEKSFQNPNPFHILASLEENEIDAKEIEEMVEMTELKSNTGTKKEQVPEACATQITSKPYKSSYFLPGKIEGKPVQFLLDTGCNTNMIAKSLFDRLPGKVKAQLKECDSHGLMADGTQLPVYGVLDVSGRLRNVKIDDTFVVGRISEDAILGMPFLSRHECPMEFSKPTMTVDGRELACTDRHGHLMLSKVQTIRKLVIAPGTETTLLCRVAAHNPCPVGIIEGQSTELSLAASLN